MMAYYLVIMMLKRLEAGLDDGTWENRLAPSAPFLDFIN